MKYITMFFLSETEVGIERILEIAIGIGYKKYLELNILNERSRYHDDIAMK